MTDHRYEIRGTLTRDQAQQVAELLGGGSVVWAYGHTYPCDGVVVRRAGCDCPQCSAPETAVAHPITATGPYRRKCHRCEREHDSNLPPGLGVSFCSHACAD